MCCGDPVMMSRTAPHSGCSTVAIMLSAVGSTNSSVMHSSATAALAKSTDESWPPTHAPDDIQAAIRTVPITVAGARRNRVAVSTLIDDRTPQSCTS
jgi:hypothetical protein